MQRFRDDVLTSSCRLMAHLSRLPMSAIRPLSGAKRKTFARVETYRF
jgi:hypothetical protein